MIASGAQFWAHTPLTVLWIVGYVLANILGTYLPITDSAAHWPLASGALPAALVLLPRSESRSCPAG